MIFTRIDDDPESNRFELHMKVLIITLWKGGSLHKDKEGSYPHEIICFMLNKCFEREVIHDEEVVQSPGAKAWPPKRIRDEKSKTPLWRLGKDLENNFIAKTFLPADIVSDCFYFLHRQMIKKVNEIIHKKDQTAPNRWSHILTRFVGETTLKDYYGDDPTDDISKWSHKVLIKIKEAFIDDDWLNRPYEELLNEILSDKYSSD